MLKILILIIREEVKKLGLSSVQIMNLFEENVFLSWNINEMKKIIKELGLEGCLISSLISFDISEERLASLNNSMNKEI